MQFLLALCAILALASTVSAQNMGKSVLVLLSNDKQQEKYSSFLGSLTERGFKLDVKGVKDSSNKLREYGTWLYDHLIIIAPKAESIAGEIDVSAITEFVDSGHSVLMAANSEVSEFMRVLASEFGVDLDDKGTKVFDHFAFATKDGKADHNLIAAKDAVKGTPITKALEAPVLFRGIASTVPGDAELAIVALSAPATSYSHDARKSMVEPPSLMAGAAISLVTAVQARNNARMVVAGSSEMFTNELFDATVTVDGKTTKTGNKAFCEAVAAWALQDAGVLKAENLRHHIIGSDEQPSLYRVSDDVEFLVDITLHEGGKPAPFKADDIQVEFTMLHPYVRQALTHNNAGTFSLRFKVPDVYGVFKYTVEYARLGYSYLSLTEQVPVRPFKHNEYERFLFCAYPYYASAATSMAAFFILGFLFLYHSGR